MSEFAWYIWPAYILTLGFMVGITVLTLRGLAADRKVLAELEKDAPHRVQRRAGAPQPIDKTAEASRDA